MLKMSPLQHSQVGVLWSFPSLMTEGLRDDKFVGTGEKLWKDALCRAGEGGLGTNAVNMPKVPRRLQSFQGFLARPARNPSMWQTSPFPTQCAGGTNYCFISKQIAGG